MINKNLMFLPRVSWERFDMDYEVVDNLREELDNAPDVQCKEFGNVLSYKFKNKVFYKGTWNDMNIKARGLFIDKETNEIVSRSYDKFFNIGERPETEFKTLVKKIKYPVSVYRKENGFLGIIGYNKTKDELWVTSKSTPEGEFANMFFEQLNLHFTKEIHNTMKQYLKETNSSMIFEVINIQKDPHIIRYRHNKIVLLDMVARQADFQKMPYVDLQKVADYFGFECKEFECELHNQKQFKQWYEAEMSFAKLDKKTFDIEGFVLEDSEGFMTKVKLPFYNFWKFIRTTKQRIAKDPKATVPATNNGEQILFFNDVVKWMQTKDANYLIDTNVVQLRADYFTEMVYNG